MNKGTRLGRRMADCTKEYTPTTSSEQEVYYGFFNVFTAARSRVLPLFLRFLRFFSTCRASSRTMASSARITQLHNKCACLSRIINAFGLMRSASAEEIPMFFFGYNRKTPLARCFGQSDNNYEIITLNHFVILREFLCFDRFVIEI